MALRLLSLLATSTAVLGVGVTPTLNVSKHHMHRHDFCDIAGVILILAVLVIFSLPVSLWTVISAACRNSQGKLLPLVRATCSARVLRRRREHRRQLVVVHVLSGGKTQRIQCEARSTVGAMREEMGVVSDAVILLVPGGRELDDEMRVGEIVREGPMTVEVRCRGVGGAVDQELADEELRCAADRGDTPSVRRLLAWGANVHDTDFRSENTPLHHSAQGGHVEVSQMLLDAGANVNTPNFKGRRPLHQSAVFGRVEVSQMLVGVGANVNAPDKRGLTPLHLSAAHGYVEVSQMLVGVGANVNAPNEKGLTPLHYSARHGRVEVSQILVEAGANVDATDNSGKTPLDLAKEPRSCHRITEYHRAVVALLQHGESEPLTKSAVQGGAAQGGAGDDDSDPE